MAIRYQVKIIECTFLVTHLSSSIHVYTYLVHGYNFSSPILVPCLYIPPSPDSHLVYACLHAQAHFLFILLSPQTHFLFIPSLPGTLPVYTSAPDILPVCYTFTPRHFLFIPSPPYILPVYNTFTPRHTSCLYLLPQTYFLFTIPSPPDSLSIYIIHPQAHFCL